MSVSADQVIETLSCATEENQVSSLREQQVVVLPSSGDLWIAGDIHDHHRNFERLLESANLTDNPQRHLVLQELIHGDRFDDKGADGSWDILYRAAALKCDFPSQVHFLLANHDLAQIFGEGIMKMGMSVCEAFNAGVKRDFPDRGPTVTAAIADFLLSFPLAVRTQNGLFACHSLPTDEQVHEYDYGVFNRALTGADYKRRTGPAYQLVWGRNVTPGGAADFAHQVGAAIVITGHQPQETGFFVNGDRHLIIASDHNQGVFLAVDLAVAYSMTNLLDCVQRFLELDLDKIEEEEPRVHNLSDDML